MHQGVKIVTTYLIVLLRPTYGEGRISIAVFLEGIIKSILFLADSCSLSRRPRGAKDIT